MKSVFSYMSVVILLLMVDLNAQSAADLKFEGEKHLKNIKMLTNGGENAEAYLSFDQKRLILQAKTDGLECDQIFTMNIDGSDKKMVSTGKGRTTCSYFMPGDDKIIYASTHLSGDKCPPNPDFSKGYVWKLYDEFEIFIADANGENIVQVTNNDSYDAEATVSPMGDKIVFTSLRDGDPELYLMDIDGSNQERITFEKGYDGGAFFSQDGSKLVYRASRPVTDKELQDYDELVKEKLVRPGVLEIHVMDIETKKVTKVTNFGKASFAPFMHPSGDKIIFCSNVNSKDPRNFDLYLINSDGTGLEQVTFNETFDGFPMFTADGKHLVFASNRFNKERGDTNVFIAEWVD
ncbi:hypothetical protein MASR2M39_21520 [Ignavibacteriales bacterium]